MYLLDNEACNCDQCKFLYQLEKTFWFEFPGERQAKQKLWRELPKTNLFIFGLVKPYVKLAYLIGLLMEIVWCCWMLIQGLFRKGHVFQISYLEIICICHSFYLNNRPINAHIYMSNCVLQKKRLLHLNTYITLLEFSCLFVSWILHPRILSWNYSKVVYKIQ